jgi:hypothetical protein
MTSKLYYITTYGAHQAQAANFKQSHFIPCDPTSFIMNGNKFVRTTPVVVQIEADEGVHLKLESNPAFHTMSLLVAGTVLCSGCVTALSAYGIVATDNMWLAAKKLGAVHPGLKPTRF